MGTIYQFNQLTKLEFQMDSTDVLMRIEMVQNNIQSETSFQISHSDLNKILGNIQFVNPEVDVLSILNINQIDINLVVYSLNFEEFDLDNSWLHSYEFVNQHKEIRA